MNLFLAQESPTAEAAAETAMNETIEMVKNLNFVGLGEKALDWLIIYGPKVLFAVLFLLIGLKVAGFIGKLAAKALGKAKVDESLASFLSNVVTFVLKVFVLIISANIIGIPITSFIAILGAAGLAVGLALKDGLGNFAGGVVLLLFKPIKVGDLVTIAGHHGFVKSITIFYTVLRTKNEQIVTIPNGTVSNGDVVNFSASDTVRIQTLIGIGYGDDIKLARQLMLEQTLKDDRIARDPEPFVVLKELGDNSVNLEMRCWSKPRVYRRVLFQLQENIKEAFDAYGVSIPYPQRDLHIITGGEDPAPSTPQPLPPVTMAPTAPPTPRT